MKQSGGRPECDYEGCTAPVYKRHCKIVCAQHGVLRDCSDPFR